MSDWQPTEAQIEAARVAVCSSGHGLTTVSAGAMRAALIAATKGYSVVKTVDLEWVASELDGVSETFSARAVRSCAKDIRDLINPPEAE